KPRINKVNLKSVTVKAGQTITLEAPYAAEPLPTMTWQRESTEVKSDDRSQMTQTDKLAKLIITKAVRADTGRYTIRLVNDSGSDTFIGPSGLPGRS
ncbi:unnamed protein product, partial [Adineta steineri]